MKKNGQLVRVNADFIHPKLSAAAVKVMFLLASIAQAAKSNTVVITNSHIAERTGLTNITRVINELYAIGAIKERVERYKDNRRKCNAYVLAETLVKPRNYRFVPISALELPKSSLRLLILYTLNCNDSGRCLLSLSQIQELSGMARGTVISCTKELQEYGYIAKQRYTRYEGDNGHNRVYVTHIVRRRHSLRAAEALRVIINGTAMNYAVKSQIEYILNAGRENSAGLLLKEIKRLFRSTRVVKFVRRLGRIMRGKAAHFFSKIRRSPKMKKRIIDIKPVLNI